MGKRTTHIWSLISLVVLAMLSCNAPHQNPLDPENFNAGYASLAGYTVNAQEQPLAGVRVLWTNENRIATSDKNGHFVFKNLIPDSGWVVFSKTGFRSDSVRIHLHKNDTFSSTFFLQATPSVYGYVTTSQIPYQALATVVITWRNENMLTQTDASGYYQLIGLQNQDGWLVFQKNGFAADSLFVEWDDQNTVEHNIRLTALQTVALCGQIKHELGSSAPVSDVRVTWAPAQRFTFTDAQGNFSFQDIQKTDGWLFYEKQGYKPDSVLVTWNDDIAKNLSLQMNAMPSLTSFHLFSNAEYDYPDRFKISLSVSAHIQDQERDTYKVFIECPALAIENLELLYNPAKQMWLQDFVNTDIAQIQDIRELVGHDFHLKITDYSMDTFTLASSRIERVVQDEIVIESPLGGQVVSPAPTFEWKAIDPGFEYSYILHIYTDDLFNPALIKEYTFAAMPDEFAFTIPDELTNGYYMWAIWCVDEFGNRARSKQAKFTVRE